MAVKQPRAPVTNNAIKYATAMMRSESAMLDANLAEDFSTVLEGQCIYLPHFLCALDDRSIFDGLKADLEKNTEEGMINWSRHLRHENPDFSPTFQDVLAQVRVRVPIDLLFGGSPFWGPGSSQACLQQGVPSVLRYSPSPPR